MNCRFDTTGQRRSFTPVDNNFFTEYLPHANELQLKVYLYGLMLCFHPAIDEDLCNSLGVSEREAAEAFCHWQALGLVRIISESPLTVEYHTEPMTSRGGTADFKYGTLVKSLNTLTAPRQFGMSELAHVYDWIEVYGLDEGAVLELVAYCMEQKGRRVSINYMSKVAENWSDAGVRTAEAARNAIDSYRIKKHGATAVLRAWNRRRRPTEDEMALYDKWTKDWGFTDDAVLAALPRLTVSGTPNFVYLDELLDRLRSEKLTGKEAIELNDEQTRREKNFAKMLFDRAGKSEPATATQRAQIAMYLNDYKMPHELLFLAADLARGKNEPFGAMKIMLNDWHANHIETVGEAEAYLKEREEKRAAKRAPRGRMGAKAPYAQTAISDSEFDALFVDLDHDLPEEQ
ncbi:MAG: DnaD domain protein [Clostridia bacterium]|nr:DnaD domain protein [Clostridia bacterium]